MANNTTYWQGKTLSQIRDTLLPGLHAEMQGSGLVADIEVDYQLEHMIVKAFSGEHKHELGFLITRQELKDGTFVQTFKVNVARLKQAFEQAALVQSSLTTAE